jgi:hypothetical protein
MLTGKKSCFFARQQCCADIRFDDSVMGKARRQASPEKENDVDEWQ